MSNSGGYSGGGGGYGSGGYGGGGYGGGYPGGPSGPAGPPPANPPPTFGGPPYGGGVPPYGPSGQGGPAGPSGGRGGSGRVVAVVVVVALLIAGGVVALVLSLNGDDKSDDADKATPTPTATQDTSAPPTTSDPQTSEPEPSTEPPTTTPEPSNSNGSVPVKKVPLSPGDCVLFATVGTGIDKVACTSPHDGQHVQNVDLPQETWPGEAAMDTKASAACKPVTEPVIERQPQADQLTWLYIYPKESGWLGGDRQVQCLVSYLDETKKLDAPLR